MNVYQLLDQVTVKGGAIVSSGDCSEMEIADARANGRFAVMDDGQGFVRRTKDWLALQLAREKAHPNTDGRYSGVNAIGEARADNAAPLPPKTL